MLTVIVGDDAAIADALANYAKTRELPSGIWFEERRKRFRVRIYRRGRVIHRSYHNDVESALREYLRAKSLQAWLHDNDSNPMTSANRVMAFANNLV